MDGSAYPALPRGRHGLSRAEVRASQRARLLWGMAEAVAERGYANASVAEVLKRVHISRQTYYEHFADKQDCFLAVLDESARHLAGTLSAGMTDPAEPLADRLPRLLTTYFRVLADNAPLAKVFYVESYAAGLPAQRKRIDVQEQLVNLLDAAFAGVPEWQRLPDPRFACQLLISGISSLVSAALVTGEPERLADAVPRILALVRWALGTDDEQRR